MAEIYGPFDTGTGANFREAEWSKMGKTWRTNGPLDGFENELLVYGDNTGMQVKVPTGRAWVEGFFYQNDAIKTVAVPAADATNPRKDVIVLRLDTSADTITAVLKQGVAAGSPTRPALTQAGAVWEEYLAEISVPAGDGSIEAGQVTDIRTFSTPRDAIPVGAVNADVTRIISMLEEVDTRYSVLAYDASDRVQTITTYTANGGTLLKTETYAYNADGTVNTVTTLYPGSAPNTVVETYVYTAGKVTSISKTYA
jgi:hypothetical protein